MHQLHSACWLSRASDEEKNLQLVAFSTFSTFSTPLLFTHTTTGQSWRNVYNKQPMFFKGSWLYLNFIWTRRKNWLATQNGFVTPQWQLTLVDPLACQLKWAGKAWTEENWPVNLSKAGSNVFTWTMSNQHFYCEGGTVKEWTGERKFTCITCLQYFEEVKILKLICPLSNVQAFVK